MLIVDVYIRIVPMDLLQNPVPKFGLINEDIGFCTECQDLLLISFPAVFERIANTPLDTFTGINGLLERNLVKGTLFQKTAPARVNTF